MLDLRDPKANREYYVTRCYGDSAPLRDPANYERPRLQFLWQQACSPVLDIGCSTGDFSAFLAEHGHSVVGVDPSLRQIVTAEERYGGIARLHFTQDFAEDYCRSVRRLFGKAKPFKTALAGDVIEHIPDVDAFISALRSVADTVVLTTPCGPWDSPEHIHIFSAEDGQALARKFGGTCRVISDRDGKDRWLGLLIPGA
jgi:SAM-dependent methyltransferase